MAELTNTTAVVDEPINLALREHQKSAEDWRLRALLAELHTWAERFCLRFKLQTPVPAVMIERLRGRVLGHFRPSRNALGLNFEIAIDERRAASDPFGPALGTLLHELLHLWQEVHGAHPSRSSSNYHNKEFREKAAALGLIVDCRGHTSYAGENSPFLDLLKAYGVNVPPLPPLENQNTRLGRLGSSKLKLWQCACPVRVRVAVPNFRARCLVCGCLFMKDEGTVMRVLPHKSDKATQVRSPLDRCREDGVLGEGTEMSTDVTVAGLHPPDPALFAGMPAPVALRWARYFLTTPRDRAKAASLRNHVLALYDPFARRSQFPAGIRFCINVYTGCEHACRYCYSQNYVPNPTRPRDKKHLMQRARDDVEELRALDLPPVPLHMSNSTDPFQEALEKKHRHTFHMMELLAANRRHFTTITFLTKNPLLLSQPAYVGLLRSLTPCQVEASLAFADERARQLYEPSAPSIGSRLAGVRRLREAGIPVSIRIDPLFPREPLPLKYWPQPRLADYGLERTQTLDEIGTLIRFASETGCQKVIVSALKVPVGRWASADFKDAFRNLYSAPWGGKPKTPSFAWRLPEAYIRGPLIGEVQQIASRYAVPLTTCWENLATTR